MRLVISGKSFALEDVPSAVDVSDLEIRDNSRKRRRTLRAPLRDAWHIRDELARRGVRVADEEVRVAAAHALEQDPVDGPLWIATYGDARAVPVLSRALDDYAPSADCAVCDYLAVFALSTAMLALGEAPSETQARKVADYERRQRAAWLDPFANTAGADEPMPSADGAPTKRTQRLGRNDPCHCGSGKKYKNCHLDLDDSRPAATRH